MNRNRSRSSYNNNELNQISHEGAGKYFHIMLNMYDDELDPYEYRLLGHYIRVAGGDGECYQSTRTVSAITRMSVGKIHSTQNSLAERGLIRVTRGNRKDTTRITIIDKMSENITRYAQHSVHHMNTEDPQCSPGEQGVHHMNTGVHHMNTGVHQVNERITLEEKDLRRFVEEEAADAATTQQTPKSISIEERLKAIKIGSGR